MYIKTTDKVTVENYPYGFRLRTTLTDTMEFDKKKGYRHVTQTVDPRNGRINAPKKSTYYPVLVRYYDENGHVKSKAFSANGVEEINQLCEFTAANYGLFSEAEIEYIYLLLIGMSKVSAKAAVMYGGAKWDDIKEYFAPFVEACVEALKNKTNAFDKLRLDHAGIESKKPKNYSPFRVS